MKHKAKVNEWYVRSLLTPITWNLYPNESFGDFTFGSIDINNKSDVERLVYRVIAPYYAQIFSDHQVLIKNSLFYCLNEPPDPRGNEIRMKGIYRDAGVIYEDPVDHREFYIQVWMCLFGDSEWNEMSTDNMIETNGVEYEIATRITEEEYAAGMRSVQADKELWDKILEAASKNSEPLGGD